MNRTTLSSLKVTTALQLCSLVLLAACSAKVSGGSGDGGLPDLTKPSAFSDSVSGPNLDGDWNSTCTSSFVQQNGKIVDGSAVVHLSINGRKVERKTEEYSDTSCQNQLRAKDQKGDFRYIEKGTGDQYNVEYKFDDGGMPQETIQFTNGQLTIGNFQGSPYVVMTKVGAVTAADCNGRHADNQSIVNAIQSQIDAATARPGSGSTTAIRQSINAFASKYAGLNCDGQTTESVVGQMRSAADMIDRL